MEKLLTHRNIVLHIRALRRQLADHVVIFGNEADCLDEKYEEDAEREG